MGLINAPVEASRIRRYRLAYLNRHDVRTQEGIISSLADAFDALPPLSTEKRRRLFRGYQVCLDSLFFKAVSPGPILSP